MTSVLTEQTSEVLEHLLRQQSVHNPGVAQPAMSIFQSFDNFPEHLGHGTPMIDTAATMYATTTKGRGMLGRMIFSGACPTGFDVTPPTGTKERSTIAGRTPLAITVPDNITKQVCH